MTSFTVDIPVPPSLNKVDAELAALYKEHGSVWKVGKIVGRSGQSVHKRLAKIGLAVPRNVFTDADRARLAKEYQIHADSGTLHILAASMGRTRHFICRQAREIGMTRASRARVYASTWKYVTEEQALPIWEDFKRSSLGLGRYCVSKKYDDLGFATAMRRLFADEWDHVIELKTPKSGKYKIGRAFEYRARDDLKREGFFVMRSPASRSPIDLLAVRHGTVAMVQCKRGGNIGVAEWNALFDLASSVGAIPVLAMMAVPRGIIYSRLLDRKDGSRRRQPHEPWSPALDSNIARLTVRAAGVRA